MKERPIEGQTYKLSEETTLAEDISGALKKEFWWTDPDGKSGKWDATVSGEIGKQSLEKVVLPSENKPWGLWEFMSYIEFSSTDIVKGTPFTLLVYKSQPGG